MAEKRFYWLKLKEDYFNNPKIKKLRKIAGGDTFTIIYLKMQLLSISNNGIIEFEGIENTIEEELALKLDEDLDNVAVTLNFLKLQGLIETNNNEFLLVDACKNIGSECDSAKRVRDFRERKEQKSLQCNTNVTDMLQNSISKSNSNSISKSKHKYGEYKNVLLTDDEYDRLVMEYSECNTIKAIEYLDEAIEMKGYKYKSHYLALRKWVFDAIKTKGNKKEEKNFMEELNDLNKVIMSSVK